MSSGNVRIAVKMKINITVFDALIRNAAASTATNRSTHLAGLNISLGISASMNTTK
jgi:hypothetical protein